MSAIAIVAATGRSGRIVVRKALAAGHTVTAIARRPIEIEHHDLTAVAADVLKPGSLGGVLAGHDAVISALGANDRGPTTIYSAGTAAIVAAMADAGVRRLVVLSSAGLSEPEGASFAARVLGRGISRFMRNTYEDMARMERLLADTDLDWTALRPTGLHDRPGTGSPRSSIGATRPVGPRTAREDLADYILGQLTDPATYGTVVAVSS